jgi:hypothetical protein
MNDDPQHPGDFCPKCKRPVKREPIYGTARFRLTCERCSGTWSDKAFETQVPRRDR